jgi:hypothetical protein
VVNKELQICVVINYARFTERDVARQKYFKSTVSIHIMRKKKSICNFCTSGEAV